MKANILVVYRRLFTGHRHFEIKVLVFVVVTNRQNLNVFKLKLFHQVFDEGLKNITFASAQRNGLWIDVGCISYKWWL